MLLSFTERKNYFYESCGPQSDWCQALSRYTWKNVFDFIHPEFRDAVRKNIEKDLIGGITPPIELRMLRVDGTSVIVEVEA